MTTTIADLVERCRRQLRGVVPVGEFTTTTEALDTSETGVDVTSAADYGGLVDGCIIEVDQELMLVTGVATNTLTVIRGFDGTDAAAHDSGATVWIAPRYSAQSIVEHMKSEIASWEPHLFDVVTITETWPVDSPTLELSSTPVESCPDEQVYAVLGAFRVPSDSTERMRRVSIETFREEGGPNGSIYLTLPSFTYGTAADIRLTLAVSHGFAEWPGEDHANGAFAWDEEVTFRRSLQDLLVWGAGARMLGGTVFNRADLGRQGQTRHAEEVGAQELQLAVQFWKAQRNEVYAQEVRRLRDLYPMARA